MGAEGAVGVLYRKEISENDESYRKKRSRNSKKNLPTRMSRGKGFY
jgi:acetyl-CoA carboxylase carboxyltransferase component